MREKELRIALVCFGGVSLAVYMHGISKEILKLVRASCALHAIADRTKRAKASFLDEADPEKREYDTESITHEADDNHPETVSVRGEYGTTVKLKDRTLGGPSSRRRA